MAEAVRRQRWSTATSSGEQAYIARAAGERREVGTKRGIRDIKSGWLWFSHPNPVGILETFLVEGSVHVCMSTGQAWARNVYGARGSCRVGACGEGVEKLSPLPGNHMGMI